MSFKNIWLKVIFLSIMVFVFFPLLLFAQGMDSGLKSKQQLVAEAKQKIRQISVTDMKERMTQKKEFLLLDVRTERERNAGYISGSVWIPRGVLEFKIQEVCKDPDAQIIVYCRKGGRSILAVHALQQLGYKNVFNLEGGINAWGAQGYPLYNWHGELRVVNFDKNDPYLSNYDIFKK